jgi:uncharacterized protein (DUF1778 family)
MLESAARAAESVLLDRRFFSVDQATYQKFLDILDAPAMPNPALKALAAKKAPWETI